MIRSEVHEWINKEVLGRWPDMELTQAMKDDLYGGLSQVDQEFATQAVKQHRADSQARHPNTARICRIARDLQKTEKPKERPNQWQDICISRVYIEGANVKTLLPGWLSNSWYKVAASIDMDNIEKQCKLLDLERAHIAEHFGQDARFELFFRDEDSARKRAYEIKGVSFTR